METEAGVFRRESLLRLRRADRRDRAAPRGAPRAEPRRRGRVPLGARGGVDRRRPLRRRDPRAARGARGAASARRSSDPLYRRRAWSRRTAAPRRSTSRFQKLTDREFIDSRLDARIRALLDAEAAPGVALPRRGPAAREERGLPLDAARPARADPGEPGGVRLGAVPGRSARGAAWCCRSAMTIVATLWTFGAIAFLGRSLSMLTVLLAADADHDGQRLRRSTRSRATRRRRAAPSGPPRPRCAASSTCACRCWSRASPRSSAGVALMNTNVPAVLEIGAFASLGIASAHAADAHRLPRRAGAGAAARRRRGRPRPARTGSAARIDAAAGAHRRLHAAPLRRDPRRLRARHACSRPSLIPRIAIDTDYLSFFSDDAPVRRDFEAVDRLLAGAVPLYVTLQGGGAGAFREPEALRAIERLQRAAEAIPGVSRTPLARRHWCAC